MITASRKLPPTPATVPTVETEKLPSMLSSSELGDETEVIGETGVPEVRKVAGVLNKCEVAGVLDK